jgi:hypothetical protein
MRNLRSRVAKDALWRIFDVDIVFIEQWRVKMEDGVVASTVDTNMAFNHRISDRRVS